MAETCIHVGTSERGCCPKCGAPWARILATKPSTMNVRVRDEKKGRAGLKCPDAHATDDEVSAYGAERDGESRTLGWRPTCICQSDEVDVTRAVRPEGIIEVYVPHAAPCIVLDPFCGAGTAGVAALRLGRAFIGVDASREYLLKHAAPRLRLPLLDEVPR
jgi:hypothetical protein